MYALNNEILRAAAKRRAQARPGWLPRLLAESLLRTWAAVTGVFDGGSASAIRGAGERKTRLSMKKLAPLLALTFILGISATTGCTNETETTAGQTEAVLEVVTDQTEAAATDETAAGQTETEATEEATAGQTETTEEDTAGQTEATEEDTADQTEAKIPFSLITEENDGPRLTRLKAALRILKHGQVTIRVLQICAATPEAGKALTNFMGRNGKTLLLMRNVIKKGGGETQEIKTLMDREVAAETAALLLESDCLTLANLVAKNTRDLYKTTELAEDYRLVRMPH